MTMALPLAVFTVDEAVLGVAECEELGGERQRLLTMSIAAVSSNVIRVGEPRHASATVTRTSRATIAKPEPTIRASRSRLLTVSCPLFRDNRIQPPSFKRGDTVRSCLTRRETPHIARAGRQDEGATH